MRSLRSVAVIALVFALMSISGVALAQYPPNPPRVQSGGEGPTMNTPRVLGGTEDLGGGTDGSVLPFTGADIMLFVVIGALAVGSGIVILRRTRSSRMASQS